MVNKKIKSIILPNQLILKVFYDNFLHYLKIFSFSLPISYPFLDNYD